MTSAARSVIAVLATGLLLMGIAVIVLLTRSPLKVVGTNSIPAGQHLELEKGPLSTCQPAGALPQGMSAIRIAIEGRSVSPTVKVRILAGSTVIREGRQIAGKGATPNVTVHVKRLAHAVNGAQVCTTVEPTGEPLQFYGKPKGTATHTINHLQDTYLHMEYLRPGPKSWWSLASSVTYRMGLGHAPEGASSVVLALVLVLTVVVVASLLTLKELR
jgi:hypothetical protein